MNNLDRLYSELSTIGFRVNSNIEIQESVDIEKTLLKALYTIDTEGRMLGLILSWFEIHGEHLVADKFFKEYEKATEYLGDTPWFTGICSFMLSKKDYRFKKGVKKFKRVHNFRNKDQSKLIALKGSVDYFQDVNILVPKSAVRIRKADVLSIDELIQENKQYKNRFIYGANWRAEIITAIQSGISNPNKIANYLGIQRSRVSVVFNEYIRVC